MPYVNVSATGEKLQKLFAEKNVKVKDVQKIFGFSYSQAIYNWLSGKTLPSIDNLVVLGKVLDVSLEDLLVIETAA